MSQESEREKEAELFLFPLLKTLFEKTQPVSSLSTSTSTSTPPNGGKKKKKKKNSSYFGTPVVEGPDFVVASAAECCEACATYKPARKRKKEEDKTGGGESGGGDGEADPSLECSLWVFCGDREQCGEAFGQCWLKHLPWPEASNPRTGEDVPWTSGLRSGALSPALEEKRREEEEKEREKDVEVEKRLSSSSTSLSTFSSSSTSSNSPPPRNRRAYHVAITASGTAVHWQSRVHYYWYLKQKRLCEEQARRANEEEATKTTTTRTGDPSSSATEKGSVPPPRSKLPRQCDMGGFTRVLHDPAGTPDDLSREIPTFVASPLPEGVDGGYVVLNRPWAFVQWLSAARILEDFVLMAEPDHLWLRPFQNPCPADGSPAAFPFFYIEPSKEEYLPLVARALGKKTGKISRREAEEIAPIGNSPTWMRTADLADLAPRWMATSQAMFRDPPTRKVWGWVLEMYGFAVSLHKRKAEGERVAEERAVLRAAAGGRAKAKASVGFFDAAAGGGAARRGGKSEEGQGFPLSPFPPLSESASEAAAQARRAFRRELRRRKRKEGREVGNGGDGGGGGGSENVVEIGKVESVVGNGKVKVLPRVMLQPPWDSHITPGAALLHYTYGCDFALNGTFLPGEKGEWRFDKREWAVTPPTREELRALRDSAPVRVREETGPSTLAIVEMLLEAAEAIPGWDEYAGSGTAREFWDGETFL